MTTIAMVLTVAAVLTGAVWFAVRLTALIRSDGYGFRASSGLPRDWAPQDLPSTSYVDKPHF